MRSHARVPRLGCAFRISAAPTSEGRRNPSARQIHPQSSICLDVRRTGTEFRAFVLAAALATAILGVSGLAQAGPNDAILLPTALPDKAELALHPENAE